MAEADAREKGIGRDEVIEAMEQASQNAGPSKNRHEYDIRGEMDRTTGAVELRRVRE